MNGPEHYAEAKAVLDHAEDHAMEHGPEWYANAMRGAQVHATLALAAAQITAAHAIGASIAGDTVQAGRAVGRWVRVLPDVADEVRR